jgi:transcriptional regulator NrdR family protein
MICVNCFHGKTKVTNSRPHKKSAGTWRRRQCQNPSCRLTFTTYEKPALDDSIAVHYASGAGSKSDVSAPFSLSKLTLSIAASFTHDPTARQLHSLPLAETVEQLLISQVRTPSADDIAATTHQVLKRFDELAALQYAAGHGLVEATRSRRGRPSVR